MACECAELAVKRGYMELDPRCEHGCKDMLSEAERRRRAFLKYLREHMGTDS